MDVNQYEIIIDGSDNFKTKFLLNDYSIKNKKILISGAINKFDGQVFTFNFKKKESPCLRCFFQTTPSDDLLNCEADGVIGPIAGIIGSIQANEFVKETLKIGKSLCGYILIVNAFNLEFRKIKLNKRKKCICNRNWVFTHRKVDCLGAKLSCHLTTSRIKIDAQHTTTISTKHLDRHQTNQT